MSYFDAKGSPRSQLYNGMSAWRENIQMNVSQHTLYGVQHIHINLTLNIAREVSSIRALATLADKIHLPKKPKFHLCYLKMLR